MLLTHKLSIPIYNQTIHFVFGDSEEVQDYLTQVYDGEFQIPAYVDGCCFHRIPESWIWMDTSATVASFMHELSHAIFYIMDDVGLEVSDQEAFCYLMSYIVEQCESIFAIQMGPIKQASEQEDEHPSS